MTITASRYHDISTGHRVYGHESKCAHLHGHNYRIHFTVEGTELDEVGRVLDFSVIKSALCMWVEDNWDHKFLLFVKDPIAATLLEADPEGVVLVDFNPTAENMACHLVDVVGPEVLPENIVLVECVIEETMKCLVTCFKAK